MSTSIFDSNNITEITLISLEEVKNGLAVDKLYYSWWLRPTASTTFGIPIVPANHSSFKPGDILGYPDEPHGCVRLCDYQKGLPLKNVLNLQDIPGV